MIKKKKSIKFRLIFRVALLIVSTFVFITLIFNIFISEYMKYNATKVLTESRDYINYSNEDEHNIPTDFRKQRLRPDRPLTGRAEMLFITSNYEVALHEDVFGDLNNNTILIDFSQGLKEQKADLETASIEKLNTDTALYYYTSISNTEVGNGYVVFFINMTDLYKLKRSLSFILSMVMLFALVITLMSTYIIASKITEPIKDLSDFAKNIGEGRYETVKKEFSDLELYNLKEAMNETTRKLEKFDTEQRIFFQNVSHELRTPLQIIKTNAEGIEFGVIEKGNAIDIIKNETDRLGELVEDIIYLSRLEAKSNDMVYMENDLRETLSYTIERYKIIFNQNSIEVIYDFDDNPVLFTYDEASIERAFQNLISNAIRYTKDKIIVRCRRIEGRIMIMIENNGSGISKEELPKIFDRFYKGEHGEHGIGLSIVKSIVTSYGGRIEVESDSKGTAFTIFF